MDETQIKALIEGYLTSNMEALLAPVLKVYHEQIQEYVTSTIDSAIAPIEEQVTRPGGKPEVVEPSVEMKRIQVLEQRLQEAEDLRVNQEKQAQALEFSGHLSEQLDAFSPIHRGVVKELLETRFKGKAGKVNDQWVIDGKPVSDVTAEFFKTPEGSHFLPANVAQGAGVGKPQGKATGTDLNAALLQAFT